MTIEPASIPLSLYIHLPWCVRKCPYCDFNSHRAPDTLPEDVYVNALVQDLETDLPLAGNRPVQSIFFGGGTPSLFSPDAIASILNAVHERLPIAGDCEITMEANPGTVEQARFTGFRAAGVNRLSLGIQSLDDAMLQRLGRIHDATQARAAVFAARNAGFDNINLDMMYALPEQSPAAAQADLAALIALEPEHISYYQLTLEPGTPFFHQQPVLPADDTAWQMQENAASLLFAAGFCQYEVSAWAQPERACRHNHNYWLFGDYLGIGAGAHGKLTTTDGTIVRLAKQPMPKRYQSTAGSEHGMASRRTLSRDDCRFEFLMNALRLNEGFAISTFVQRTGLPAGDLNALLAKHPQLLQHDGDAIRCTTLGRAHLNTLLTDLLPEPQMA